MILCNNCGNTEKFFGTRQRRATVREYFDEYVEFQGDFEDVDVLEEDCTDSDEMESETNGEIQDIKCGECDSSDITIAIGEEMDWRTRFGGNK